MENVVTDQANVPKSNQEKDQINRSNKIPRRKITHLIFKKQNQQDFQDVQMVEAGATHQSIEQRPHLKGHQVTLSRWNQTANVSFRDMLRSNHVGTSHLDAPLDSF